MNGCRAPFSRDVQGMSHYQEWQPEGSEAAAPRPDSGCRPSAHIKLRPSSSSLHRTPAVVPRLSTELRPSSLGSPPNSGRRPSTLHRTPAVVLVSPPNSGRRLSTLLRTPAVISRLSIKLWQSCCGSLSNSGSRLAALYQTPTVVLRLDCHHHCQ